MKRVCFSVFFLSILDSLAWYLLKEWIFVWNRYFWAQSDLHWLRPSVRPSVWSSWVVDGKPCSLSCWLQRISKDLPSQTIVYLPRNGDLLRRCVGAEHVRRKPCQVGALYLYKSVNSPAFLGNYVKPTHQQTDMRVHGKVKLPMTRQENESEYESNKVVSMNGLSI